MPTYTVSVSHDLYLDGAVDGVRYELDFATVIADDMDIFVGKILVQVKRAGSMGVDVLAGVATSLDEQVDLVWAVREMVSKRDIDQSNGHIRIGDRKFHYQANDASFVPRIGDRVVPHGESIEYEVLAVDVQTLGTRYLVWCRA